MSLIVRVTGKINIQNFSRCGAINKIGTISRNIKVNFNESSSGNSNQFSTSAKRLEQPVKFSTSKAKSWDPLNTFADESIKDKSLLEIILFPTFILIFLVYFTMIREPNDIDEIFSQPLEKTIPNIKEMTLRNKIAEYEALGLNTASLKESLKKELELKKAKNV
jgi:hypothetical protein